jgi:hypothetical protein
MKKIETEGTLPELEALEKRLEERIALIPPSPFFRISLKDRLENSKIYARRRELGATWVASLGLSLVLALVGMLIYAIARPRAFPEP